MRGTWCQVCAQILLWSLLSFRPIGAHHIRQCTRRCRHNSHIYIYIYMFSPNLSPSGRIRQVQNTTSCPKFGTINTNIIRISTVPGGTVQTKIFSTNQKRFGIRSNFLRNARWNLRFSCTDMTRRGYDESYTTKMMYYYII